MKIITYEGVVENGRVQLPSGVSLPEKAKVFVIVPEDVESGAPQTARVCSPRLVHPEQANDFAKQIVGTEEHPDAGL